MPEFIIRLPRELTCDGANLNTLASRTRDRTRQAIPGPSRLAVTGHVTGELGNPAHPFLSPSPSLKDIILGELEPRAVSLLRNTAQIIQHTYPTCPEMRHTSPMICPTHGAAPICITAVIRLHQTRALRGDKCRKKKTCHHPPEPDTDLER